jgi:hypothetical protein
MTNKTMITMTTRQLTVVVPSPVTNVVVVVLPLAVPHPHLQTLVALPPLTLPTRSFLLLHSTFLLGVNPQVLNRAILLINNRQTLRLPWAHLLLLSNNTNKYRRRRHRSILRRLIIILVSSSSNNNNTINNNSSSNNNTITYTVLT